MCVPDLTTQEYLNPEKMSKSGVDRKDTADESKSLISAEAAAKIAGLRGQKILVTGGAGFLGRAAVELLQEVRVVELVILTKLVRFRSART